MRPANLPSLTALVRLTRASNLLIIAAAQYFTAGFLLSAGHITDWRLFLLATSTVLIAAAGYIINDYYDVKIDLINKPDRVVIGKGISRRTAIFLHTALSVAGVAAGTILDWKIGAVNFFSAFLLWVYSNHLKRQPLIGNLAVALLTSVSIVIVNVLYPPTAPVVLMYATFAFFMTLVREVIKDMEDVRGDNTFGCRTLPIIWGIPRTKIFLSLLVVTFTSLIGLLAIFTSLLPTWYFSGLVVPIIWLVAGLSRADTVKDFYRLSLLCKFIMVLGILSMLWI
jgi:4-hydroxybenzoate polyprenyltransferase